MASLLIAIALHRQSDNTSLSVRRVAAAFTILLPAVLVTLAARSGGWSAGVAALVGWPVPLIFHPIWPGHFRSSSYEQYALLWILLAVLGGWAFVGYAFRSLWRDA